MAINKNRDKPCWEIGENGIQLREIKTGDLLYAKYIQDGLTVNNYIVIGEMTDDGVEYYPLDGGKGYFTKYEFERGLSVNEAHGNSLEVLNIFMQRYEMDSKAREAFQECWQKHLHIYADCVNKKCKEAFERARNNEYNETR